VVFQAMQLGGVCRLLVEHAVSPLRARLPFRPSAELLRALTLRMCAGAHLNHQRERLRSSLVRTATSGRALPEGASGLQCAPAPLWMRYGVLLRLRPDPRRRRRPARARARRAPRSGARRVSDVSKFRGGRLFDHLVGAGEERGWNGQAEHFSTL
jgi:hypothetical protein